MCMIVYTRNIKNHAIQIWMNKNFSSKNDSKRISAESFIMSPQWPNWSTDWTELCTWSSLKLERRLSSGSSKDFFIHTVFKTMSTVETRNTSVITVHATCPKSKSALSNLVHDLEHACNRTVSTKCELLLDKNLQRKHVWQHVWHPCDSEIMSRPTKLVWRRKAKVLWTYHVAKIESVHANCHELCNFS